MEPEPEYTYNGLDNVWSDPLWRIEYDLQNQIWTWEFVIFVCLALVFLPQITRLVKKITRKAKSWTTN